MAGWRLDPQFMAAWMDAAARDPILPGQIAQARFSFALEQDGVGPVFVVGDGHVKRDGGTQPDFILAAPAAVWEQYLLPIPPRHHHNLFALRARVPEFAIQGEELRFIQHCHIVRRLLDIGRWLMRGNAAPAPASLRPRLGADAPASPPAGIEGKYLTVSARDGEYSIYSEWHGSGPTILCLHTAGSDCRQFHRLMAEPAMAGWRMVALDLPWHGKSPPPAGAEPRTWRLDTQLYVELIMGFVRAAGLDRPVVLGASMSGEICLELALRHPEAFRAIVACEATDHIPNRRTFWSDHPQVNQAIFVPEWIEGLMAPDSPAECATEIWWQYSQGGAATFAGDIHFYSGEWDARDRVHRIDTTRCPLFMLTGEYDYSATCEASEATAAKIKGVHYQRMDRMGHFPFAENPRRFLDFLSPILDGLRANSG